jgi:dienelactone hydrolase
MRAPFTSSAFLVSAKLVLALASSLTPGKAQAAKVTKVEYAKGAEKFEGFVAVPSKPTKGKLPGVLIVHNWMGVTDETRAQAERFADLGYVVFAADVYGKGVRPSNAQDAGQLSGKFKGDRGLLRDRLALALEEMKKNPAVDTGRLFAIGYCFGGTAVVELARSGADVDGVVSFHGGLDSPTPADGAKIKGAVLALHGAIDPYVPAAELAAFEKEMNDHKVDWQMVKFGGAVHSFSDKAAGTDPSKGAAYDARADARSFEMAKDFLAKLSAQ